ncbi:MAG: rod shape-determining protein [Lachnospiraceae bacterium]|nr:rod shape-determining protein [Lachnospiraceae bacterium]
MDTINTGNQINMNGVPADLIFGLDIGTRSVVGTIGYKNREEKFIVVAQAVIAHETRAMLDGQIHDIGKVAETIVKVKERLEEMTDRTYQDVCIAAAGRVLKTVEEEAEVSFASETVVTNEHVYSLDMLAVEKAHTRLREQEGEKTRFYCVGYSVKQYYQNDYPISNLEGHKCNNVKTELIATFLPDEVVDGLYAAVERAGLSVANLTLEPIAAINVAIPERFRLLNIALVDVGAGTSDISITRDGSIIAYGMIPAAGDKFTECIAKHYLVDFQEADRLKCASTEQEEVEFHDIMGLPMTIPSTDVAEAVSDTVQAVARSIADKIIELNGDKTVSAVFVVGGGGKIRGFIESLADYLELPKERVALRGTEVLGDVTFLQEDVQIDSLLVTPIGICLNYYEQRNNFIFVYINEERIRLYDNNNLTVLDAALQVGLPNEMLFPQKGDAVRYSVNGEQRMLRGEPGEAAVIRLNGEESAINTPIDQGDVIEVTPSTKGESAVMEINQIPEYKSILVYYVNGKQVTSPRLVSVNGALVSEYYEIQDGDEIEVLDYYTLEQVFEYMDVTVEGIAEVNHLPATADTKVYENFSVDFVIGDPMLRSGEPGSQEVVPMEPAETQDGIASSQGAAEKNQAEKLEEPLSGRAERQSEDSGQPDLMQSDQQGTTAAAGTQPPAERKNPSQQPVEQNNPSEEQGEMDLAITVNGDPVILRGKPGYIMVDVLDFYPVDTAVAHGERLEIKKNSVECNFTEPLSAGDVVLIQWVD